jgi:hypothetical protein
MAAVKAPRDFGLSLAGRADYGSVLLVVFLNGEQVASGHVDLRQWDYLKATTDFRVEAAPSEESGRDAR